MKSAGYVFEPNRATCTALPKSRDDVEGHSQKKKSYIGWRMEWGSSPRWYNHFIVEGCWGPNIKSEMINCDGYNSTGNKTVNSGARVHPGTMILVTLNILF